MLFLEKKYKHRILIFTNLIRWKYNVRNCFNSESEFPLQNFQIAPLRKMQLSQ